MARRFSGKSRPFLFVLVNWESRVIYGVAVQLLIWDWECWDLGKILSEVFTGLVLVS